MKIGILGGGQLARMIIEECNKFAFEFYVLSNEKNSPAGQITKFETEGDWNDENILKEFAGKCDIITLENEFIDYKKLEAIEQTGKKVFPCPENIMLIQDKYIQKKTLHASGIPVAEFTPVNEVSDITEFSKMNGYPLILKSRTMGYDGKGNITLNSESEIEKAFRELRERGELMCEKFVNFDKEIATQVVRNTSGEIKVYPVVETIQKNHICELVISSSQFKKDITDRVNEIAVRIVSDLKYTGVMGIEMFLRGKEILVNELAPRVHNSGHYTIEGSYTSQFENHIRAVLDLPLGNTEKVSENCVMINLLGKRDGESKIRRTGKVLSTQNTYLHIYGKKLTRTGRKMGHITVIDKDLNKAINNAYSSANELEF
ncbi:MAG: 5-(carboxyamino)imidazole ribonucleotide synthase [Ignavibacteria bacterium]|nr:5-(carboxyamino)imidazole ribonucleotide synthase [Ignavibacteria bacterium]